MTCDRTMTLSMPKRTLLLSGEPKRTMTLACVDPIIFLGDVTRVLEDGSTVRVLEDGVTVRILE